MFDFSKYKNRTLVMGILNITPDSFSDGGKSFDVENAVFNALKMESEGADIIDIGACSTAPGNTTVSLEEELRRLKKAVPLISTKLKIPVSVDTTNPEVAEFAVKNGAVIVNDESGYFNENMARVVKEFGAGWVFMHTGAKVSDTTGDFIGRVAAGVASTSPHGQATASLLEAQYPDGVTADVLSFFCQMRRQALKFGIKEEQLCYDYGIGFGKSRADDALLLKSTALFSDYQPLLVGVSRKRIIGEALGETDPANRVFGSVAAETVAAFAGAGIIRAHDVKAAADAVRVVSYIKQG